MNTIFDKFKPNNLFFVCLIAIIVSLVTSGVSILFILAIKQVENIFYSDISQNQLALSNIIIYWKLLIIFPIGGLIIGFLSYYLMPTRKNVGFAAVIENMHEKDGEISVREGLGVGIISAISLGVGASVGRYGPSAHIGAAIGSFFSKLFKLQSFSKRTLVACAAAAAIAASFNTPVAAVIFTHEVIIRNFSLRIFTPISISATIGAILGRLYNTDSLFTNVDIISGISRTDYIIVVIIGITSSLAALLLMKLLQIFNKYSTKINIDSRIKPLLGGILLALIAMLFPQTIGPGIAYLNFSVENIFTSTDLGFILLILIMKILTIAISFSSGFNGGLFAPALFIGGMVGAFITSFASYINMPVDNSQILVLVAIACVASSILGSPIGMTILFIEMTGNYYVAAPILFGVAICNFITYKVLGKSFFDIGLKAKGIITKHSRERVILSSIYLHEIMKTPISIPLEADFNTILESLKRCENKQELFVVDKNNKLVGVINSLHLINHKTEGIASDFMKPADFKLRDNISLNKAFKIIDNFIGISIPIIDQDDKLIGYVSEANIITMHHDTSKFIRSEQED